MPFARHGLAPIVVIGGIQQDVRLDIKDTKLINGRLCLPEQGKLLTEGLGRTEGGGGLNVSVGLARLGHKVRLAGAIGVDEFGRHIDLLLASERVKPLLVQKPFVNSGLSIVLEQKGREWVLEERGANDDLKWADISKSIDSNRILFVSHLSGDADKLLSKIFNSSSAKHNDLPLFWSPGATQFERGLDAYSPMLKRRPIIFLNQKEAIQWVSGKEPLSAKSATEKLLDAGASMIVMTKGKRGATAFKKEKGKVKSTNIRAGSGKTVDLLGAGDAFASAFTSQWLKNREIDTALKAGQANASSVIRHMGTLKGLLGKRSLSRTVN